MLIRDEMALSAQQAFLLDKLKARLYAYITQDCGLPEWKQVNTMERAFAGDAKAQAALAWKNALIAEKDRVKAAIVAAETVEAAQAAYLSMNYLAPPFAL